MSQEKTKEIIKELQELTKSGNPDFRAIVKLTTELSKFDPKFQRFSIDAKTLIHLGRDSIKDHTTALLELVKNSYDADSLDVDVEIFCRNENDIIRVSDNGFGMTKEQLINYWLRIGFSNKRNSKVSVLGRRKTGEKGIGRISTDRLGGDLELITKTESDGIIGLKVNWDDFDTEGKDVFDIEVEITNPTSINIPNKNGEPSKSGTEIKITKLRQSWSSSNIENLYYELSALTPPFKEVKDFSIDLKNDIAPQFSKPVNAEFYKAAEIEVTTIFDGSEVVYYSIKDKYSEIDIMSTISLKQFYTKTLNIIESDDEPTLKCGPVEVKLLFFLREGASVLQSDFSLSDLREFLDNNNGVKIYRDHIAVKPYGFPRAQLGYDWLGLAERKAKNPAGISRAGDYTITPNQLVGAVFITRDNNLKLLDSAAREGLVESEAFYDMKYFIMASIRLLETHRANIYPTAKKEKQKNSTYKEVEKIKEHLDTVRGDLTSIKNEIENNGDSIKPISFLKPIVKTISSVNTISEEVDLTITELLKWQRVLSGLATMGISSAVFGHETEGSITQFQGSTNTAIKLLKSLPPDVEMSLVELDKAIKHSKKVAAWGAYALTRVQREKRSKRNVQIFKTIDSVIKELKPAFEASSIEIKIKGDNLYSKTYQMDIESILVNLLTNAYTAAISSKKGSRKVQIEVGLEDFGEQKGYFFSVSDTGPGVAKEFQSRIFDPLYSTKNLSTNESNSVGTGLGLTIVKSIVDELLGKIILQTDPVLKGASFKIWLPKE